MGEMELIAALAEERRARANVESRVLEVEAGLELLRDEVAGVAEVGKNRVSVEAVRAEATRERGELRAEFEREVRRILARLAAVEAKVEAVEREGRSASKTEARRLLEVGRLERRVGEPENALDPRERENSGIARRLGEAVLRGIRTDGEYCHRNCRYRREAECMHRLRPHPEGVRERSVRCEACVEIVGDACEQ